MRLEIFNVCFQVEKSAFASDTSIRQMMTHMEDMYATAFGTCCYAETLAGVPTFHNLKYSSR